MNTREGLDLGPHNIDGHDVGEGDFIRGVYMKARSDGSRVRQSYAINVAGYINSTGVPTSVFGGEGGIPLKPEADVKIIEYRKRGS